MVASQHDVYAIVGAEAWHREQSKKMAIVNVKVHNSIFLSVVYDYTSSQYKLYGASLRKF